jgi:hypothetical protein
MTVMRRKCGIWRVSLRRMARRAWHSANCLVESPLNNVLRRWHQGGNHSLDEHPHAIGQCQYACTQGAKARKDWGKNRSGQQSHQRIHWRESAHPYIFFGVKASGYGGSGNIISKKPFFLCGGVAFLLAWLFCLSDHRRDCGCSGGFQGFSLAFC